MSAVPSPQPGRHVAPLAWDSAEFGFGVGKLTLTSEDGEGGSFDAELLDELGAALLTARGAGVRLVYLESPELTAEALARLVGGASLAGVYADDRATFEKPLTNPASPSVPATAQLRSYPPGLPSPELVTLGLQAGAHSRFRKDPRFPDAAFVRLYSEWVRRSALREVCSEVLVAEATSTATPCGFVTVGTAATSASVGLIAVSPDARNLGLGSALMWGAENVARSAGCRVISVMTQYANDAACRLYRKMGYALVQRSFVYHLWLT